MRTRVISCVAAILFVSLLSCCYLPNLAVRIGYGNWPIGNPNKYHYVKGMSQEEIRLILGSPHERYSNDDGESWHYYCDAFGIAIVGLQFDHDGILINDWW